MTDKTCTPADFEKAALARHPTGNIATRQGPNHWVSSGGLGWTDADMAEHSWVPVQECPDPELHEPVGRSTGPRVHASPGLMQTVPESFTRFMAEKDELERLGRLVQDVRDGDGHTVAIDGVKIAKCDTYGRTREEHALMGQRNEAEKALTEAQREAKQLYLRAEEAEQERDEVRAALTELAPAEVCVRGDWFKPSELPEVLGRVMDARDEAQREAKRYYLRAAESRPLTPDAITDAMVERALDAWTGRLADGPTINDVMYAALTAALTEPPKRPEGAEDIERMIGAWDDSEGGMDALGPEDRQELADFLAERGVRIVGEDGGDETPDVCPHVGGPGGDCECAL